MWGGHSKIRYALIGLVPYSFHYDLSESLIFRCRYLPYFIALNDLHNFLIPVNVYKKFFREEWLFQKTSLESFDANSPYGTYVKWPYSMNQKDIESYFGIESWKGKYYPKTRNENIKILDDYLTLCEENNIRPVMFMVPVTKRHMENFNSQLLEEFYILVEQACQKHPSARFVAGWKLQGFTYEDFYDHGHLNRNGAAKFSAYLNGFIEQLEKQGS